MGRRAGDPVPLTFGANIVILVSAAAGGIATARALGPAGRGELALLIVWSHFSYVLATRGTPSGVIYITAQAPREWPAIGRYTVRLAISHAAAALLIAVIFLTTLAVWRNVSFANSAPFALWAPLSTLSLYGASFTQGQGRFRLYNVLRLLSGALPGVLAVLLAGLGILTVNGLGIVYCLATLAATATAAILAPELRDRRADLLTPERHQQLKSFSRRNFAVLLTSSANDRVDQLVLGIISPAASLGTYAVASTAAGVIVPLSSAASAVAYPKVSASLSHAERREEAAPFIRIVSIFGLVLSAGFVAFAGQLIPLIYGQRFEPAVAPARMLGAAMVFASIKVILTDVLRASNRPGRAAVAEATGAIITAGGAFLAGGGHLVGVAAASAGGFLITCLLSWWWFRKDIVRGPQPRSVHAHG